ncbi:MAG: M48 family metallopeptidase [Candidatus Aenigmatarchaeota archaeon]
MPKKVLLENQISKNKRNTVFICALMFFLLFGVISVIGYIWFGEPLYATIIGFPVALVYIIVSYSFSVKSVLAATRARPVDLGVRKEKLLDNKVEELAIAAGLPKPKVYIQDSSDINAFATGKKYEDSVVCVTRGALDKLSGQELEGVLAHEMSHIQNRDILLATVIVGVVGSIALLSEILLRSFIWGNHSNRDNKSGYIIVIGIVFAILAPIFARLTYLAISRNREYLADASGAHMSRNPEGLASALEKIKADLPDDPKGSKTAASLYIANPFSRVKKASLWSTHPPIDERVKRLRNM